MITLSQAIINCDISTVRSLLDAGEDVNALDEFGFTPLIETTIMNNIDLTRLLLEYQADVNGKDIAGGTALHWAVENNNKPLCELLLEHQADPNSYNYNSEPVLAKAILRKNEPIKHLLFKYGASSQFANDFINIKLLGHRFDLQGAEDIVDHEGHFTELSFEGFFLEFSLQLLQHSLSQYINNFAAKKVRNTFPILQQIVEALGKAAELMRYQQYQTHLDQHLERIHQLLEGELLIIPTNYEGHAIAYLKYGDYFVKCDRRKKDQMMNGITIYKITQPHNFHKDFICDLIYAVKDDYFIDVEIPSKLGLQLRGRLMIEPQMSGNCSWANIAATIPAAFFLMTDHVDRYATGIIDFKHDALSIYRHWREWDQQQTLQYCCQNFERSDKNRKASFVAILAAVFFQRFDYRDRRHLDMARRIYKILKHPDYSYVLNSYEEIYCQRRLTPAGKNLQKLIAACQDSW